MGEQLTPPAVQRATQLGDFRNRVVTQDRNSLMARARAWARVGELVEGYALGDGALLHLAKPRARAACRWRARA